MAPFGTLDLTVMLPPIYSAIFLQMLRPMPVPFGLSFFEALSIVNGAKSFRWSSSVIPHPKSATSILTMGVFESYLFSTSTVISISPL